MLRHTPLPLRPVGRAGSVDCVYVCGSSLFKRVPPLRFVTMRASRLDDSGCSSDAFDQEGREGDAFEEPPDATVEEPPDAAVEEPPDAAAAEEEVFRFRSQIYSELWERLQQAALRGDPSAVHLCSLAVTWGACDAARISRLQQECEGNGGLLEALVGELG